MTDRSITIYSNATIITLDPQQPRAEALAVQDGRVLAVGRANVENLRAARRIDLAGHTVVPGFNDCHMHILSFGLTLEQLDVGPPHVESIADIMRLVAERAAATPANEWVRGRGYNQNLLVERRHPNRFDLDTVSYGRPVVLWHTSGHALACNTRALELAEITRDTVTPLGGEIERDEHGEPTGVLKETAMELLARVIPPPSPQQATAAIVRAMRVLARQGVTSASDAATGHGESAELEIAAYRAALESGQLAGRVVLMPQITYVASSDSDEPALTPHDFDVGDQPEWLRIGATKIFADGALTTRTAALRHPFIDNADNRGLLTWEPDRLASMILRAHRAGWQIATHAIGDRAIETVLDAYTAAQEDTPRADARHRIEHCMLLDMTLAARIQSAGIVPIFQPEFIARLGDAYIDGLGLERATDLMPAGWFRRLGVPVAFSSDRPVIPGAPLWGVRAALERRTPKGVVLGANHCVSAEEALQCYAVGSAYATFSENQKGALRPGLLADFVVLDRDITRIPAEAITESEVLMTVVGGAVMYEKATHD
jgi:predicted amidohydrolase YtcJ